MIKKSNEFTNTVYTFRKKRWSASFFSSECIKLRIYKQILYWSKYVVFEIAKYHSQIFKTSTILLRYNDFTHTVHTFKKNRLKLARGGSNGTHFDHGQFEIETFRIYAPSYCTYYYHGNRLFIPAVSRAGRNSFLISFQNSNIHCHGWIPHELCI